MPDTDGQGSEVTERGGFSRRQMIKASAVAGAAAWTAPVIIDSLTSPAAAGSCGDRYYVKIVGRGTGTSQATGTCYNAGPLCTSGTATSTGANGNNVSTCDSGGNYRWVCNGNGTDKFPGFSDSNPGNDTTGSYTITLVSGCTFSDLTSFKAVGNYNWQGSGGDCKTQPTSNGATQVTFPKNSGGEILDYMYLEFVCAT